MAIGAGDQHNNNNNSNNNNNNNKRLTRRSYALSLQPEQPQQSHPDDFALALALQEQENAFGMPPLTESHGIREIQQGQTDALLDDDDEEDEDEDESEEEDFDESFFYSQEFDGVELEFLEGEDSNGDEEDMEEDDIDPDELSYEELIALGEIVGEENRGLSTQEISSCLTKYTPSSSIDSKTIIDKCVICQVEYEKFDGEGDKDEKLVALPCKHSYHLDCITTWLLLRKVCPICGTEVSLPKTIGS